MNDQNPYTPPTEPDQRRSILPVFPLWEILTIAVLARAGYLFVMVGTDKGTLCLIPAVLLAIIAYGRRNRI